MTDQGPIPIYDPELVAPPTTLEIISGSDNPSYASAKSAEVLASINQHPEMEAPPSGHVALPGGLIVDGSLLDSALVRELTGAAEEKLARVDPALNLPLWINVLLEEGVDYIGGIKPTADLFGQLLVGDREMLILGIRQATYGDDLPMHLVCPICGNEQDTVLELAIDVPIKKLSSPSIREFTVELRQGSAVVVLATAAIQDKVFEGKRSDAERKTLTLQECVKTINGVPTTYDTVLNMGLEDRKRILNFLADTQPGPNYEEVSLPCSGCERDLPVNLSLAALFRG